MDARATRTDDRRGEAESVLSMPTRVVILLVEDDFDVRQIVRLFLTDQDYEVLEADDGDGAMAILEGDAQIDLLLTDIVMPGACDGLALARARHHDIGQQ